MAWATVFVVIETIPVLDPESTNHIFVTYPGGELLLTIFVPHNKHMTRHMCGPGQFTEVC